MSKVGQNPIYTYIYTVYLVISKPKIPYVHRIYMVLANPKHVSSVSTHRRLPLIRRVLDKICQLSFNFNPQAAAVHMHTCKDTALTTSLIRRVLNI